MSVGENANIDYVINATNVTFQGRSSLDRLGAVNYFWTFGDGTNFTAQTVSHTYAVDGDYSVHLSAAIGSGHAAADALVMVPSSPPTITAITDDVLPDTGALSNGQTTNDNDLTVKVSLPSGSGVTAASAGDVLQLVNPWQTVTSYTLTASDITNGYATVQTGFLFDGTYDLTAQIISDGGSGATSQPSGVFEVTVDTTAPAAPVLGFGPGVSDTDGATASEAEFPGAITVRGSEPGTTIAVTFTNGSNTVTKTVPGLGFDQAVQLTAADITALTDGTILVSAVQIDGVGNTSPASTTAFTLDTNAPAAPIVTLNPSIGPGGATAAEAEQASGVVIVSAEAGSTITVNFNGNNVVSKTLVATGSAQAVVLTPGDISFLGDGPITVGAIATDAAGNLSSPSSPAFFILDTLPPPPGELIITDPLIDATEAFHVPFVVFGVDIGSSGVATFTDGTLTKAVNIFAGQISYAVDLTGFGHNVTSSLTIFDAAGNSNTSAGNSTIVATSPNLALRVSEFQSLSPSEWRPNPAYTSVTLLDTGFNLANFTDFASLGPAGVEFMQSTSGLLSLTVAQYLALGSVAITPTDIVTLRDTNANFSGLDFSTLQAGGIDKIDAIDNTLTINLAQYGALGAGLILTGSDVVTLADSGATLSALSPAQIAALTGKGIDFIHATDVGGMLTLDVAQALALGNVKLAALDAVTVADDGATISALTSSQIFALANKGVDALQATSGDLTLTRLQYQALGAMTLSAAGEVVLADSSGQLAALTASQFAGLGTTGVDRIDSLNNIVQLSLADYQALGAVALTGSDVVTLSDTNANLTGLDFSTLQARGIDKIDATDNTLTINLAQYGALGAGLALTNADVVTLTDDGAALASFLPANIAALAGKGIDKMSSTTSNVTLDLAQFNALGAVILSPTTALTLNGSTGNDNFSFSRQTFTAADHIIGGDGTADTLTLNGNYSAGLMFDANSISGVERLGFSAGHSYKVTTDDGNVAAGQQLLVNGSALGVGDSLIFDGSAETNGRFNFRGGAGSNTFTGGTGADTITAGAGADTLRYTSIAQSTLGTGFGTGYDTVAGFNGAVDRFALSTGVTFDGTISGTLSKATFNANLTTAMASVDPGHAAIFLATAGNLAGATFLVANTGEASDLVVGLNGATSVTQTSFTTTTV